MCRVLIIDDHPIVRNGIKMILESDTALNVVAQGGDTKFLIEYLKQNAVDIVLLDISLPGISGFEILPRLKALHPAVKVLMLSALSEDIYARKSLEAGASGFINKESAPEELLQAISRLRDGGVYVSSSFAEKIASNLQAGVHNDIHDGLSVREFQIFTMIGEGYTVSEIAEELALSVKTVSTYRTRVLDKTGMKNNSEIIRYCIKQNIA